MNTSKHEFLSAWLDDEAGTFEQRRLLDELKKDDELAQTMSRYALIGEVMRTPTGQTAVNGASLLSRIQLELDEEPAYDASTVVRLPTQAKPMRRYVGMGIAATVATLAISSVLWLNQATTAPDTVAQTAMTQPLAVASLQSTTNVNAQQLAATDARIRQIGQVDPQTRDVLKQYVSQHVRYASTTGIAPSLRAVSYAHEN